jgi:hypothetical protein
MGGRWLQRGEDSVVLAAALGHGVLAFAALAFAVTTGGAAAALAAAVLLAVGICWGSNTVSHIHLHGPLFRPTGANAAFSLYLSALLGVPQRWWTIRHLRHHGLAAPALNRVGLLEIVAVLAAPLVLVAVAGVAALAIWLGGLLFGFALCALQGHQEHARSDLGIDHRSALYNRLWFNDGFHAAHHRAPGAHWSLLPRICEGDQRASDADSAWPPLLRWMEGVRPSLNTLQGTLLDLLEELTLPSLLLRRLLVSRHARAFSAVLAGLRPELIREVTIVGGGLFPRTALVLMRLLPGARLTIVDSSLRHLLCAERLLRPSGSAAEIRFVQQVFDPGSPLPCDLLVVPLGFRGDRTALYHRPAAPLVIVHDWIWRRRGARGAPVALWLAKRLNLVSAAPDAGAAATPRRSGSR